MNGQAINKDKRTSDHKEKTSIIGYFLNLYASQINAPENALADFKLADTQAPGPNTTYELRVQNNKGWETRRMSIGRLGEDSGSKSKCFYVIYDDHLVVKIPPNPIKGFKQYLDSIKAERHIVTKVAPMECIVPGISVILKRIHTFQDAANLNEDKLEEKYIEWLGLNSHYQEYLRIDGSFVHFMDLSKYSILGEFARKIHSDIDSKVYDEILKNPGIIWEPQGFVGRYGDDKASVCFKISNIYKEFEIRIRALLKQYNITWPVPQYKIQEWLLIYLAGKRVPEGEKDLTDEFIEALNSLLNGMIVNNQATVSEYRHIVEKYVGRTSFSSNKFLIGGIISNLLDLLARLNDKKVAMRDLKPDNILVVGDSSKNPRFINFAEGYTLGLIDVETAIDVDTSGDRRIDQPALGGTPFYATPSHLISNELLKVIYKDLSRILLLQDWYAVVVMIYNVTTGEHLFEKTATLLPKIKKAMSEAIHNKQELSKVIKNINRIFWKNVLSEFNHKTNKRAILLKSVEVPISKIGTALLRNEIREESRKISGTINKFINSQKILKNDRIRQDLIRAPYNKIIRFMTDFQDNPKQTPEHRAQITKFFNNLKLLKSQSERYNSLIKKLDNTDRKITAYDLLTFMLNTVFKAMYRNA